MYVALDHFLSQPIEGRRRCRASSVSFFTEQIQSCPDLKMPTSIQSPSSAAITYPIRPNIGKPKSIGPLPEWMMMEDATMMAAVMMLNESRLLALSRSLIN
jgi:hypothetical protein